MNSSPIHSSQRHSANVGRMNEGLSQAAQKLATSGSSAAGRKMGESTSNAKTKAAHANGAKGGRPVGS